ncbi:DUF4468 domain-containing protein [Pedobacter sp. L105]|uniref:DUF4468 domain-containing protein n=1 Tax=Pedobacter sp. L105 TaxID=1641871 RepID=UPI00131AA10F|nr:DUF4468 domain-containing protein [Pedobacter sp. L105]
MKKTLLTIFAGISILSANAQQDSIKLPFTQDGRIEYTAVIQTPNLTVNQIYQNAKYFFRTGFKKADDVITVDDTTAHIIAIKSKIFAPLKLDLPGSGGSTTAGDMFDYLLTIEVKDGKYRYTISGFSGNTVSSGIYPGYQTVSFDGTGAGKARTVYNTIKDEKLKKTLVRGTTDMLNYLNDKMTTLIASLNSNIAKSKSDF